MDPSALAIPGTGSTLNAVGSLLSDRVRPFRVCASMAYGNALRCFRMSSLHDSSFGTYWLMRVRSRVHLDIFPNSDRASMTRRLALLVRKTRDRETMPAES